MEGTIDEHGLHRFDRQPLKPQHEHTYLVESLVRTAKLWDTLNPHATAQARQRLVQKIAAGLGVCLIL